MYVLQGSDGAVVGSIEDAGDGSVKVRLHPRSRAGDRDGWLVLREPTTLEYAELRILMRNGDRLLDEKFPQPEMPPVPPDIDAAGAARMISDFNRETGRWHVDREDFVRDPGTAPYLAAMLETCRRLGGNAELEAEDLTVEAYSWKPCRAVLEVWEGPLGGPVEPPETSAPPGVAVPLDPPGPGPTPEEPDSPEPEPSSRPGTGRASRSPRTRSTA